MKVLLVNPRWAFVAGDYAGSGIPYWPLSLNILGTLLEDDGHEVEYLDLPANGINVKTHVRGIILQGADPRAYVKSFQSNFDYFVVYALNFAGLSETLATVATIRSLTSKPIFLLQNSQAVTSFQFSEKIKEDFTKAGVSGFLLGGPLGARELLEGRVPIQYQTAQAIHFKTRWTTDQIHAYNQLPYSHGPKNAIYVPILTSLGCPFGCDFCVIPSLTNRKWNYKNSTEVIEEMSYYSTRYGIKHFQIEDLNPTINWPRWLEISKELQNHDFTYAIVSGTKCESIPLGQAELLFESGARYISISPESGSKRLMLEIGKHFDHKHAIKLTRELHKVGIRTQACFLLAHPKENFTDKIQTMLYMAQLTIAGIDEMALFTVAPHPGSELVREGLLPESGAEVVTFSGVGRNLKFGTTLFRFLMILYYLLLKFFRPLAFAKAILRTLRMTPETKTENILSRVIHIRRM
jgi:hypothetical protein